MHWNLKTPEKSSGRQPLHDAFKSRRLKVKVDCKQVLCRCIKSILITWGVRSLQQFQCYILHTIQFSRYIPIQSIFETLFLCVGYLKINCTQIIKSFVYYVKIINMECMSIHPTPSRKLPKVCVCVYSHYAYFISNCHCTTQWSVHITWTNRMHYLILIYFNSKPLHVSSRLAAHHQEDQLCIYSNWYSHVLCWLAAGRIRMDSASCQST